MGFLWSCKTNFTGSGAESTGDWYDRDSGFYNATIQPVVDGSVEWTHEFSQSIENGTRVIIANGLPFHITGNFPISSADDAYQYDRNPNSISAQSYAISLTANPSLAANSTCLGGEIGIAISGVVINAATDDAGRDAVATEILDSCQGHPHQGGVYHYHSYSFCLETEEGEGHSDLIGWAFDGFGIFGPYGQNGQVLESEDLGSCHGETHEIIWDGESVEMFHYHTTFDFPYTLGCYRGNAIDSQSGSTGGQEGNSSAPAGNGESGNGNGPPQEAINACSALSEGASCSFSPSNGGSISGVCASNQGQLSCAPADGPPN